MLQPKMGLPDLPLPTHVRNFSLTGNGAGPRSMPAIMASAMVGWRFLTMLMLSPQLAQWAATLVCTALVNPTLPSTMGAVRGPSQRLALLVCPKWRGDTPTLCCHASANSNVSSSRTMQPEIGPCRCAHQQQQPARLRVFDMGDLLSPVLCSSSPSAHRQKLGDQLVRPTL